MSDTTLSQYQAEASPFQNPGYCFLCRTANPDNGPFINTRKSHVWFNEAPDNARDGVVYICKSCVTGLAEAVELADAGVESVQARLTAAARAGFVTGYTAAKRELQTYVELLGDSVLGAADPSSAAGISISVLNSDAVAAPEQSSGIEQPVADEAVNDDRPDDVDGGGKGSDGISGNLAAGHVPGTADESDLFGGLFS
jgi:hypothetical protein